MEFFDLGFWISDLGFKPATKADLSPFQIQSKIRDLKSAIEMVPLGPIIANRLEIFKILVLWALIPMQFFQEQLRFVGPG
jgi:hypothetical protein